MSKYAEIATNSQARLGQLLQGLRGLSDVAGSCVGCGASGDCALDCPMRPSDGA